MASRAALLPRQRKALYRVRQPWVDKRKFQTRKSATGATAREMLSSEQAQARLQVYSLSSSHSSSIDDANPKGSKPRAISGLSATNTSSTLLHQTRLTPPSSKDPQYATSSPASVATEPVLRFRLPSTIPSFHRQPHTLSPKPIRTTFCHPPPSSRRRARAVRERPARGRKWFAIPSSARRPPARARAARRRKQSPRVVLARTPSRLLLGTATEASNSPRPTHLRSRMFLTWHRAPTLTLRPGTSSLKQAGTPPSRAARGRSIRSRQGESQCKTTGLCKGWT
jgi:hypothetical protein